MYKRILLAVDGSRTSNKALREAVKLATEQHARLRIVYVVDRVPVGLASPYSVTEAEEAEYQWGQKVVQQACAVARGAGAQTDSKMLKVERAVDRIASLIAKEAQAWRANLVVIGTHGRRGISRLFLGSVAEGIVRVCSKPVLLVRGK